MPAVASSGPYISACPPGTQANVAFNVVITPETPNLGRVLHDAGYATGFVGKWHTGFPEHRAVSCGCRLQRPRHRKNPG